jgi:hypothetical protein
MHTRRFEWKAPAMLFLVASVAFAGACIAIEHAHAQGTNIVSHVQGRNPAPSALPPLLDRAPSLSTGLQSIEPIHCASIARDPCLACKSGIGIWIKSERWG